MVYLTVSGAAPDASWPRSVTVECGELTVRLESRSFWTLYRVEFQGKLLGEDQYGSHYGNVFRFHKYGFVGSGHVENEEEKLLELTPFVDGKLAGIPGERVKCERLKLVRKSLVRNLEVDSEIEIDGRSIVERTQVTARSEAKLDHAFFAMYPWVTAFSDYAILNPAATTGSFTDSKEFRVSAPARQVAIYSRSLECGVLTEVLEAENLAPWREDYWDYPARYRKHYSRVLIGRTLREGERAAMTLRITPFAANETNWRKIAITKQENN